MEIKNKLAVNDIAYTFENSQIKEHLVSEIKVLIDEEGQRIEYLLTDLRWYADSECFSCIESIFTYLKEHIDKSETELF